METAKRPSAIEALKLASEGDPDYLKSPPPLARIVEDYAADERFPKKAAATGVQTVEAALFPPVVSLTIDKDVTDLTIRGSVTRLTVNGTVETLIINGQVVNLHLVKG